MKRLMGIYLRLKIRDKLIFSYIALLVIWVVIFNISNQKSIRILNQYLESSVGHIMDQSELNLSSRQKDIMNLSDTIFFNYNIQRVLSEDKGLRSPLFTQFNTYVSLTEFISGLLNVYKIYNIKLYLFDDVLYSNEEINFFHTSVVEKEPWFKEALKLKGAVYWTRVKGTGAASSTNEYIAAVRVLKDLRSSNDELGVLSIEMNINEIINVLDKAKTSPNTAVYLVDENDTIQAAVGSGQMGEKVDNEILAHLSSKGVMSTIGSGKSMKALMHRQIYNKWRLITVIPYMDIIGDNMELQKSNIILIIIMSVVSIGLIVLFTESIVKRMAYIGRKMAELNFNETDQLLNIKYDDEISIIERKFNEMIYRIKKLIEEIMTIEVKKSKAELRALQAQINPHFLYNIMDTINWMARDYKAYDISTIVTALGRFFRLSLSKGNDIISVRDEVEHMKLYILIQKVRFKNMFEVDYFIDEEVMKYSTIKIILQPIVENAIKHGIRRNPDLKGIITIYGRKDEDIIEFKIEDNGPLLKQYPENEASNAADIIFSSGYGLANIKERLELYYGEKASIRVESDKEQTVATVRWPAQLPES